MRFLRYILCALLFVTTSFADTININWMDGNTTYAQTTCEIGGDVILPTPPTKRGYTFKGWAQYTRLEYIESTGGQYIDTGYYSNNNTEWILKSRKVPAVGYINGTGGTVACNYFVTRVPQWAWYSYKVYSYQFDESLVNEVSIKYRQLYINGRLIDTQTKSSPGEWTSPYSFTLFGLRKGASTVERYAGDIHRFTIIENDIIIRDFIPVKRRSDGEIGMYDIVEGKFYGNDGTGLFIAGPVAENQSFDE